jgi:hypothetical protein
MPTGNPEFEKREIWCEKRSFQFKDGKSQFNAFYSIRAGYSRPLLMDIEKIEIDEL